MLQTWLKNKISGSYPDIGFEVLIPPDSALGDYSVNLAFVLAQKERKNPMQVAQAVATLLENDLEMMERFEKIQAVAPGFVNLFLKTSYLQEQLSAIHGERATYGSGAAGKGKLVIVEYSAPNIAKPMHVGHLRSTIIGDALANIYEYLGYEVVRWNYLGDWGTQFGKLIAAYKMWGNDDELKADPIGTMLKLYVRFHAELKDKPEWEVKGQEEFKKLEDGDAENKKLWELFREESLKEFRRSYELLGVKFDVWRGESDYEADLKPMVGDLLRRGEIIESEGALLFDLEKFGLPPALVRKSDGSSLYFTRDLATLKARLKEYEPAKILYVVANQQALHFEQLFTAAKVLGWDSAELHHVKFGLVLGQDKKKLATREGNAIPLQEVMDQVVALAREVVKAKNPDLPESEKDEVARTVGIGALKYNDLKEHRNSDIIFDWKRMLDLTGNSGPYLQYTYARLESILAKAGNRQPTTDNIQLLIEPSELALMRHLLNFPDVLEKSAVLNTTNGLALYLYNLSSLTSRFYEAVRILGDENTGRMDARLMLIETVAEVLKKGLELLGIGTLKRI